MLSRAYFSSPSIYISIYPYKTIYGILSVRKAGIYMSLGPCHALKSVPPAEIRQSFRSPTKLLPWPRVWLASAVTTVKSLIFLVTVTRDGFDFAHNLVPWIEICTRAQHVTVLTS